MKHKAPVKYKMLHIKKLKRPYVRCHFCQKYSFADDEDVLAPNAVTIMANYHNTLWLCDAHLTQLVAEFNEAVDG